MKKSEIKEEFDYEDESNGTGIVNTTTEAFKEFHRLVTESANKQSKEQIVKNKIFSIKFRMEKYLNEDNLGYIIQSGEFLKQMLDLLGIRSIDLAEYLSLRPSNLSAIINGSRRISPELAVKLGYIFGIPSDFWTNIEGKNALMEIEKEKSSEFQKKYKLEDLVALA